MQICRSTLRRRGQSLVQFVFGLTPAFIVSSCKVQSGGSNSNRSSHQRHLRKVGQHQQQWKPPIKPLNKVQRLQKHQCIQLFQAVCLPLANGSLVTCGICLEGSGPLCSFVRHTTTMASPNVPDYVSKGLFPPRSLSDVSTEPTLSNIMAHQKYLPQLRSSRSTSMVKKDIRTNRCRTCASSSRIGDNVGEERIAADSRSTHGQEHKPHRACRDLCPCSRPDRINADAAPEWDLAGQASSVQTTCSTVIVQLTSSNSAFSSAKSMGTRLA